MKELEVNGHRIELYDQIDELPITRHHKFNKLVMVGAGIGDTTDDADRHLDNILVMNKKGDKEAIAMEVQNMRNAIHFIMNDVSPTTLAFAVRVKSIDGIDYDDITDHGLNKVVKMLEKISTPRGVITSIVDYLKKKLMRRSKTISRDYPEQSMRTSYTVN